MSNFRSIRNRCLERTNVMTLHLSHSFAVKPSWYYQAQREPAPYSFIAARFGQLLLPYLQPPFMAESHPRNRPKPSPVVMPNPPPSLPVPDSISSATATLAVGFSVYFRQRGEALALAELMNVFGLKCSRTGMHVPRIRLAEHVRRKEGRDARVYTRVMSFVLGNVYY
jgi:hypothetical protein